MRQRLSYLVQALRLIWAAAPAWTVAWAVLLVVQGLLPAVTVYVTKMLVDSVAATLGAGFSMETVRAVAAPAAVIVGVLLLGQVMQGAVGWVRTVQTELIQDHIKQLIHRKAVAVDLEFYDTPDYFDHMARANGQAEARSMSLLTNLGGLLQNAATLVAIAGLLIPYSVWLPLVLLLSTLPALWVVVRHSRLHHAWWKQTTEKRRWVEYYDLVLTSHLTAPEVRIFALAGHFQNAYANLRRKLRESKLRLLRNQNTANFGAGILAFLVTGGVLGWMLTRAWQGAATLGDLALFYQAFNQGQGLMRTMLTSMGQLYSDTLFLEHLFTFLRLQPTVRDPDEPLPVPQQLRHGIAIKNVSFRYPGSEQLALDRFDLFIPAGKTVAIVGANGAGKSTLVKLLCRFYDPVAGCVEIDGVDIRAMRIEDLWRQTTVLFQSHVNYAGTVAENIAMGEAEQPDAERIEQATQAGIAETIIARLPNGYDTMLGKQFRGGMELSLGQWQRLAIARAFYRRAPIVLLDEPTSAMDSWAETLWLKRLRKAVEGRTAVIVTHRFTTAMRADLICVMDGGRVVEVGSHDELLARGGLYAASWAAQTRAEGQVQVVENAEEHS